MRFLRAQVTHQDLHNQLERRITRRIEQEYTCDHPGCGRVLLVRLVIPGADRSR